MGRMRQRLAMVAATIGAVGALAPLRLLGDDDSYSDESTFSIGAFVAIVLLAMAAASAVAVAFGDGKVPRGWAIAAIVVFCAVTMLAGWGVLYLGYFAALALGLAVAAGEPLPPADPGDDRLSRPMPRP